MLRSALMLCKPGTGIPRCGRRQDRCGLFHCQQGGPNPDQYSGLSLQQRWPSSVRRHTQSKVRIKVELLYLLVYISLTLAMEPPISSSVTLIFGATCDMTPRMVSNILMLHILEFCIACLNAALTGIRTMQNMCCIASSKVHSPSDRTACFVTL